MGSADDETGQGTDQPGRPHSLETPVEDRVEDRGATLMLAWQRGDERAFEALVAEFSGQVYALLTRFLGHHPGREDLVQDVFLRVVRARDRYEPRARFTTWLYRIVYNLAVNETQRRRTLQSLPGTPGEDGERGPELEDERVEDPSGALERQGVVDEVRLAISGLPDNQRMALVLAKYHELPYVEIGEVLGSSEKAIKSLIHRARETLRGRLAHLLATGEAL